MKSSKAIVEAVMKKRKMAAGGMVDNDQTEDFLDDDSFLDLEGVSEDFDQPEAPEVKKRNRISSIMKNLGSR